MSPRRPRLLFLTFYFPPVEAIASVRTGNIAKHLACLGWEIEVVTPDPALFQSVCNVERISQGEHDLSIRRILTGHRWRFLSKGDLKPPRSAIGKQCRRAGRFLLRKILTDSFVEWYTLAEKACAAFEPGTIDVVLASGSPWGTFSVAGRIARRLKCPLCLDYRDLWTTNPHSLTSATQRTKEEEWSLLRDSAAVTTVSRMCAAAIRERCPEPSKVHVISNGYDPDDLKEIAAHSFDHWNTVVSPFHHQ